MECVLLNNEVIYDGDINNDPEIKVVKCDITPQKRIQRVKGYRCDQCGGWISHRNGSRHVKTPMHLNAIYVHREMFEMVY